MRRRRSNPLTFGVFAAQLAIGIASSITAVVLLEWWRRQKAAPPLPRPVAPGTDVV